MKKKIFLGIFILFILACVPFKITTYKDGGTTEFQALLYKYVSWIEMINADEISHEQHIFWFPNNFKDIDDLVKISEKDTNEGNSLDKDGKVIDNIEQENLSENEKDDTTKIEKQGWILKSYNAGKYEGEESLNLGTRKKLKGNDDDFEKNWKHPDENIRSVNGYTINKSSLDDNIRIDKISILKDEKEVYSDETMYIIQEQLKNFVVDNTGWWLLYQIYPKMILVHNGKKFNNFDNFFLYSLKGKIFYFFKKTETGNVYYYLGGNIYRTDFTDIIDGKCCEQAAFNLRVSNDGRLAFWGITDVSGKDEQVLSFNEAQLSGLLGQVSKNTQENSGKINFPENEDISEEMKRLVAELQKKHPHVEKEDIEREVKNYYIMSIQEEDKQEYLQQAFEKYKKKDNQFGEYTAFGVEPFWSLEVNENSLKYSTPEIYDEATGKEKWIPYQIKITENGKDFSFEGKNIKGTFTKQDCITPKGDFIAYTVNFEKEGQTYSGCGELK